MAEPGPIRLFVAVALPTVVTDALVAAQARMRRCAERSRLRPRFIEPAALHVTLKFFGWVDASHVERLSAALASLAAQGAIRTRLGGWVAFGSVRRARIVAVELDDSAGRIAALAERFETEGEAIGVERETRPFRPHVTVIRIKRPGDVAEWIDAAELAPVETTLDQLVLYQSVLHPTGAEYRPLATVALSTR